MNADGIVSAQNLSRAGLRLASLVEQYVADLEARRHALKREGTRPNDYGLLSQAEVAKLCGVSQLKFSRAIRRDDDPVPAPARPAPPPPTRYYAVEDLHAVATALGLDAGELLSQALNGLLSATEEDTTA